MRKQPDPFWTVRGVYGGQDVCLVVEGNDPTAAECFATKRGVDVVFVEQASSNDIATARERGLLWRYTPETRLKCFGRPISPLQAVCLLLCGWATVFAILKAQHIYPLLKWQF
jgi:hypothetical protein